MADDATTSRRHHGNRHGRSEHARVAVMQAADDLLLERGFAALTVEGIAAAAGVAKQTIYRWWPSKTAILFDAYVLDAAEHFTDTDHGDLGPDLRDRLSQLATFLTRPDTHAVFCALAGQAQHDPAVAARFRTDVMDPQRARDRQPLQRALQRGHLGTGFDIEAALDELTGPIYYRILLTNQSLPRTYTDQLVTHLLGRLTDTIHVTDQRGVPT
ncbi:TetR/AcrR family transcriptional regulator [Nonomuraea sp. NPDC050790]|uniref:TetR/AcrR family transcriptional regulator n=1 Tax=Nonomuraea sp. NPDC050790 TaxID=3364371 RepID=UPI0037B26124